VAAILSFGRNLAAEHTTTMIAAFLHCGRAGGLVAVFAPPPDPAFIGAEYFWLRYRALRQNGSTLLACVFYLFFWIVICCFTHSQTGALAIGFDRIHGYTECFGDLLVPLTRYAQFSDASFLCVSYVLTPAE
jgi:hypothetical protein